MTRKTFLTLVSLIAVAIGLFALTSPGALLESKGVVPNDAARLWVREVGLLIFAQGVMSGLVRGHADSPTLRAFLLGSGLIQLGLFPLELIAWGNGLITKASGVVPNSVLHAVLAASFGWFFVRSNRETRRQPDPSAHYQMPASTTP